MAIIANNELGHVLPCWMSWKTSTNPTYYLPTKSNVKQKEKNIYREAYMAHSHNDKSWPMPSYLTQMVWNLYQTQSNTK
jgi:hypothetical protein